MNTYRKPIQTSRSVGLLTLVFLVLLFSTVVQATEATQSSKALLPAEKDLVVLVGTSRVLNIPAVQRVQVADPAIADVVVASEKEVIVIGIAPGLTSLHTWSAGKLTSYNLKVVSGLASALPDLVRLIDDPAVAVTLAGNDVLVLSGTVMSQAKKERALSVAQVFNSQVIDLISVAASDAAEEISAAIADPKVQVSLHGDAIVLEGVVDSNTKRQRAEQIALAMTPQVVNLLQVNEVQIIRGTAVVTQQVATTATGGTD